MVRRATPADKQQTIAGLSVDPQVEAATTSNESNASPGRDAVVPGSDFAARLQNNEPCAQARYLLANAFHFARRCSLREAPLYRDGRCKHVYTRVCAPLREHLRSCVLSHLAQLHRRRPVAQMVVGAHLAWAHSNWLPPASEANLTTLFVEPQPSLADRLRRRFAGDATVLPVAVCASDVPGGVELFHLDERRRHSRRRLPSWASQVASLSRSHVLKHAPWIPDVAGLIVSSRVPCKSVTTLLREEKARTLYPVNACLRGGDDGCGPAAA